MTRRAFLPLASVGALGKPPETPVVVPVHRLINSRAKLRPRYLRKFSNVIWPETLRDFRKCGIEFQISDDVGEIRRSPGGKPIFLGLRRDAVNLVVTDTIPIHWDGGRALKGVATIVDGCHLCVIALRYAHGHRIPLLSTNTCVHEMLHVFLQDIFVNRPSRLESEERELRIDWYATRLWLFGRDEEVRRSAEGYLRRCQAVRPT
jgi:hypothetical protein